MAFSFKQSNKFSQSGSNTDQNSPMLIQDGYYSPNRTPLKDTPKSILKDTLGSGSKAKKNIIINETLNETHKFSHRSENTNPFDDKATPTRTLFSEQTSSNQKERPKTASTSQYYGGYNEQSGRTNSASKTRGDDRYYQDAKSSNEVNSEPMNLSGIPKHELTDFQKAYIKKTQREKEQAKYYELLRKHDMLNKDNIENKPGSLEEKDQNSLKQIENKISLLEGTLGVYPQMLQDSIAKEKAGWAKQHEILNRESEGKKKKEKEIESDNKASFVPKEVKPKENRQKDNDRRHEKKREENNKKIETFGVRNNESELRKTMEGKINGTSRTKKQNENIKIEDGERKENQNLKESEENINKEIVSKKNFGKSITTEDIFEKEKELLKTIEEIRAKLVKSIAKKPSKENTLKSPSKSMGRTYPLQKEWAESKSKCLQKELEKKVEDVKTVNVHQTRRAYGAEKLKVENSEILNQGLSSSYNAFNWYADQSLKLSKNI